VWDDLNRFRCPKEGQEVVFPQERDYKNLFLYLEDIAKANGQAIVGDYVTDNLDKIVVEGFIHEQTDVVEDNVKQETKPQTVKRRTNFNEI